MRTIWCVVVCLAIASGCAAQRVRYVDSTKAATGASYSHRLNFFVGGLGKGKIDTARCGEAGAAKVTTYFSFVDNLLGLVTLWIYVPRHVDVVCAGEG